MAQKRATILSRHLRNRHRGVYALGPLARRRVGLALIFVKQNSSSLFNIQSQFRHLASEEAS